jgi:glycosyltransferase involved in cell wall biosynthesis
MLAPEFIPIRGGVGTYIVELIKNMPNDVEIHVLTPKPIGVGDIDKSVDLKMIKRSLLDRITLHYLGTAKDDFFYNFKFQLNCFRTIPNLIKKYDIDIIHSESALPDLFLNPRKVNIPIVTTIHTTITDEINFAKSANSHFFDLTNSERFLILLGPILKALETIYYGGDRKYITVSKWMKDHVINDFRHIDSDRMSVIHNGVDPTRFNSSEKKHFKKYFPELADIDVPKALFLSRWAARKGISYLVKAIPKIMKKTDIHFIFAGECKNPRLQKSLKNCTFLGYIPNEKIPCLYSSSDIFLLPSLYENFPICLLEAMASELAVIGTNVGGIPELITHEENGLIIKPKNTKEIIDSVIKLAENPKLRTEFGKKARLAVENKFTWEKIAIKTREQYQKIIDDYNC